VNIPENLYYNESHEWVLVDGDLAIIGITDFAQSELGDIVYLELPEAGAKVSAGQPCGIIEAVKSAEDLISPLSGTVEEKNQDAEDSTEIINESPYEDGWLFRIRLSNLDELENLMSALDYRRFIES